MKPNDGSIAGIECASGGDLAFFGTDNTSGGNAVFSMRIRGSDGNVGIGESNPDGKLHVTQASGSDQLKLERVGSAAGSYWQFADSGGMQWAIDSGGSVGAVKLRLDNAGLITYSYLSTTGGNFSAFPVAAVVTQLITSGGTIRGIVAKSNGTVIHFHNGSGVNETFTNEDGAATTTNRMRTSTGGSIVVSNNQSISFVYSGSRWVQLGN